MLKKKDDKAKQPTKPLVKRTMTFKFNNLRIPEKKETQKNHVENSHSENLIKINSLGKKADSDYARIKEKLMSFRDKITSDTVSITEENTLSNQLLSSMHKNLSGNLLLSNDDIDSDLNFGDQEISEKKSSYSSIDSEEIDNLKQKLLDFNSKNLLIPDETMEQEFTLKSLHQYLDTLTNTLVLQLQKNEFKENFLKKSAKYQKFDNNSFGLSLDYTESGFELLENYQFIIGAINLSIANSFELPSFQPDEDSSKNENLESEVLNRINSITSKLSREPIRSSKKHLSLKDAVRIPIYAKYSQLLLENQPECWSKIEKIDWLLKQIIQSVSNIQIEVNSFITSNKEKKLVKNSFNSGGVLQTIPLTTLKPEPRKRRSVKDIFGEGNPNLASDNPPEEILKF